MNNRFYSDIYLKQRYLKDYIKTCNKYNDSKNLLYLLYLFTVYVAFSLIITSSILVRFINLTYQIEYLSVFIVLLMIFFGLPFSIIYYYDKHLFKKFGGIFINRDNEYIELSYDSFNFYYTDNYTKNDDHMHMYSIKYDDIVSYNYSKVSKVLSIEGKYDFRIYDNFETDNVASYTPAIFMEHPKTYEILLSYSDSSMIIDLLEKRCLHV